MAVVRARNVASELPDAVRLVARLVRGGVLLADELRGPLGNVGCFDRRTGLRR